LRSCGGAIAETTIRSYVHGVEHFSRHFHRRPDQLGPEHIRQYQAMLFSKLKFSPNTVTQRLGALRFFYIKVLKKNWSVAETPYPRKVIRLPEILSPEEVARLISAAELPFYRILLMTLYGTGARRTEAAHLNIDDIDSRRMNLLFHSSAETLLEVACDPRHLGAEIGFFTVLHSWDQRLLFHPHVHCVLAAGRAGT